MSEKEYLINSKQQEEINILITAKCRAVSNYIIEAINKYNEDKPIREQVMMSAKRLQRILYFCNIEYMKKHNGENLFEDSFYAWPTGPVIPGIYYAYTSYYTGKNIPMYEGKRLKLTNEEKFLIHKILIQTQNLSTMDLINITNANNGPWQRFYNEHDSKHNQIIPNDEMYIFYLNKTLFTQTQKEGPTLVKRK